MGKKNQYSFSKRQREIKKKKKAEEKRLRKLAKNAPEEGELELDEFGEPIEEEDDSEDGDEVQYRTLD